MDVNLFWKIAVILLAIYLMLILFPVIKYIKKPYEYMLIVLGIILVHGLSWLGFTIGLMRGVFELIFSYKKIKKILIHKKLRYKTFKNNASKKICTFL
jgi:hypothetical protein